MQATSTTTNFDASSSVLRRVGIVLIAVGVLDIAWMFYVVSSGAAYASSFNIFAVIAGVLLYRQSLRTARVVTVFAAFFLSASGGLLLVFPLIVPVTLIRTYLRITPMPSLIGGAVCCRVIVMLWWVYQLLASPTVRSAIDSSGLRYKWLLHHPKAGFWYGAFLTVLLVIVFTLTSRSETAQEAVRRARTEKGSDYRYFVSQLSTSWSGDTGTHVQATVLAYTDSSVETVTLEWRE